MSALARARTDRLDQFAEPFGICRNGGTELGRRAHRTLKRKLSHTLRHFRVVDSARERVVKEEIAKGGAGGFTELSGLSGDPGAPRKRIGEEWRNRRSGSGYTASSGMGLSRSRSLRNSKEGSEAGSANTVWSAGNDDD